MSRIGIVGLSGKVAKSRQSISSEKVSTYFSAEDQPDEGGQPTFCNISNVVVDVYYPYQFTLQQCYTNKVPIFADSGFVNASAKGVYSTTDAGSGSAWYFWDGTGWRTSGQCS